MGKEERSNYNPLLEAGHVDHPYLLEAPYPGDEYHKKAILLIQSESAPLQQAMNDLEMLPMTQERPREECGMIISRMESVKQMIPRVEEYILSYIDKEQGGAYHIFDSLILSEEHPKQLYLSRREYQIAVSHIAFRSFAYKFKHAPDANKARFYQDLVYFGAIHDFLVGAKTNLYMFLKNPDDLDLDFIEKMGILVVVNDEKTAKKYAMDHLLRGNGISFVDVGSCRSTILHPPRE